MKGKAFLKQVSRAIAVTIVFFGVIECLLRIAYFLRNAAVDYVPIPYVIGHSRGPVPPWLDDLRILEPDHALIWKNRPNLHRKYVDVFSPVWREEERTSLLRQFFPEIPTSLRRNSVWEISLNSGGFRDVEFSEGKASSTFRIICLGDSWTFGTNVGQRESYPQQLQALLRREFPETNVEVLNLGV